MLLAVILVVGQLTPNYDPFRQTISQMGTPQSEYASWLNGTYVLYGTFMLLGAIGFSRALAPNRKGRLLAIFLGIHALGAMLLAIFPDNLDTAGSTESYLNLHNFFSALAYLPIIGAAFTFYSYTVKIDNLHATATLGLIAIAINIPMPFLNQLEILSSAGGFLQRVMYAFTFSWLVLLSWLLLQRNRIRLYSLKAVPDKSYRKNGRVPTSL
jgi:hypothetical membrane protein